MSGWTLAPRGAASGSFMWPFPLVPLECPLECPLVCPLECPLESPFLRDLLTTPLMFFRRLRSSLVLPSWVPVLGGVCKASTAQLVLGSPEDPEPLASSLAFLFRAYSK